MRVSPTTVIMRVIGILVIISLTACDYIPNVGNLLNAQQTKKPTEVTQKSFAVAPQTAWMPWYMAEEEGEFQRFISEYGVDIQLVKASYQETIQKFIAEEVDAVAITNIDAIAQLVRQGIETNVILITDYSNGNDALVTFTDAPPNLEQQTVGVVEFSSRHYLLDRYLTRNQIPFDKVALYKGDETELSNVLTARSANAVAVTNPNIETLLRSPQHKVLFDSRQIPNELIGMIVVRRTALKETPGFSQALLATWFAMMERLQGNRRGPTLEALARIAGQSLEAYTKQLGMVILNDNPTKALSSIRNRTMRKTMRHIRYFIERHQLTGEEPYIGWVSYPGRDAAVLHMDAQPLQQFIAPPEAEDI